MPGPAPRISRQALRDFHAEGLSDVEMASHLSANVDYVARLRKRLGLPRNYRPSLTPEQLAQVDALLADRASHRDIARTLGVHPTTIRTARPGTAWTREEVGRHALLHTRHADLVRVDLR